MGCTIVFRFRCELSGLCSPAKGDPRGRGTFGLRWCPSPAPVPRRDIIPETRSVSYLKGVAFAYPSISAIVEMTFSIAFTSAFLLLASVDAKVKDEAVTALSSVPCRFVVLL